MSLREQNRMLEILHKNKASRKNIAFIIKDLKNSEIFDCPEENDYMDDWCFLEEKADWLFSNASNFEKIDALKGIDRKQKEFERTKKSQYVLDQEKRVIEKRNELIREGVIKPDVFSVPQIVQTTTRFGRSPLHEAIAMRDIHLIEKYIKNGKYLDHIDNNGHTPKEMAFYEGYKEVLILFKRYEKK